MTSIDTTEPYKYGFTTDVKMEQFSPGRMGLDYHRYGRMRNKEVDIIGLTRYMNAND